jgi:tetratricopeptide (TPR) repeat protein
MSFDKTGFILSTIPGQTKGYKMNGKYALLLWGFMQIAVAVSADTTGQVLEDVDSMVAEKKYLSAFELLNEQEDGNSNPDIALKKAELALKYFVNSINHKIFSFKDLKEDEDIMNVRGAPGRSVMFSFDIEIVLTTLIKNYPEDRRLHVALADYYLDVYERYRGRWEKSDEDVLKSARSFYDKAVFLGGDLDSRAYFRAGKTALYMKDLTGGAKLLETSVQKSDSYAPARYNLAYAYLFQDRPAEAAPHAVAAYDMYDVPSLKADAAMLAGQAYLECGNPEEALKYFLLCDKIAPNKYENLRRLMGLYVKLDRGEEAKAVGERIFGMDPVNPTGARVFLDIYAGSSFEGELPGIFNGLAAKYAHNHEAVGNALYHLSVFYMHTGEIDMALKTIDEAERNFRKSLKEDHAVFKAIEHIRQKAGKSSEPIK